MKTRKPKSILIGIVLLSFLITSCVCNTVTKYEVVGVKSFGCGDSGFCSGGVDVLQAVNYNECTNFWGRTTLTPQPQ